MHFHPDTYLKKVRIFNNFIYYRFEFTFTNFHEKFIEKILE